MAERKDRLVQARVDEDLDETLREAAKKQRVSVSQLIRNVLEDTFHLVDNVVARAANLTETVVRDAKQIGASARGETRVGEGEIDGNRDGRDGRDANRDGRDSNRDGSEARNGRDGRDGPAGNRDGRPNKAVKAAPGAPELARPAVLDAVAAWQPVLMNRDAACVRCQTALPRGANAMLGIFGEAGQAPVWLCVPCAGKL